jgi:hypothetical protein
MWYSARECEHLYFLKHKVVVFISWHSTPGARMSEPWRSVALTDIRDASIAFLVRPIPNPSYLSFVISILRMHRVCFPTRRGNNPLTPPYRSASTACPIRASIVAKHSIIACGIDLPQVGAYDGKCRGLHKVSCRIKEQLAVPNHQDLTGTRNTICCL